MSKQSIQRKWDESYQNYRSSNPLRWPDPDLIRLVSRSTLVKTKFILDYGCGEGRNTRFLIEKFPDAKIVCVDSSPKALQILKNLYGNSVSTSLVEEHERLRFENGFDLIICWGVTHYVQDVSDFLKYLHTLLNPNGSLIISFQGERDNRPRLSDVAQTFTHLSAKSLLKESGFETMESGASLGEIYESSVTWHSHWYRTVPF